MSDCPYPHYIRRDEDGRCISTTCPARENCPGEDEDVLDATAARLDALEREIHVVTKDWADFKRVLGLFIGRTEGGDCD